MPWHAMVQATDADMHHPQGHDNVQGHIHHKRQDALPYGNFHMTWYMVAHGVHGPIHCHGPWGGAYQRPSPACNIYIYIYIHIYIYASPPLAPHLSSIRKRLGEDTFDYCFSACTRNSLVDRPTSVDVRFLNALNDTSRHIQHIYDGVTLYSAYALHYNRIALHSLCIAIAFHCNLIALQSHCIAIASHCNRIAIALHRIELLRIARDRLHHITYTS